MSADLREYLVDGLTPLLPSEWKMIGFQRTPAKFDQVIVVLKFTEFEPMPQAPIGSLMNDVVLTVASPHTDIEKAETELDDAVRALCMALDALDAVQFTGARKASVTDNTLGWDITLAVRTDKE